MVALAVAVGVGVLVALLGAPTFITLLDAACFDDDTVGVELCFQRGPVLVSEKW